MKRTGPTNAQMEGLIDLLKKISIEQKAAIWRRIADDLEKPTRKRREVNLYKIDKFTKDSEAVIIPGKVLGTGALNHKVVVAAWSFSEGAKQKIMGAKGSCMSITDMLQKNPKGKNLRIMG